MTAIEQADLNQAFQASSFEELDSSHEFGTNHPELDLLAGSENDDIRDVLTNRIEVPISVPSQHVPVANTNRPHNKADDSTDSVVGSRQATTAEICSLNSVNWAARLVQMQLDHAGGTVTMVSLDNN